MEQIKKEDINFVITDLDDTIWDWLEMWYQSFMPYLNRIVEETGININTLKKEFKALHEKYGTTEMSFIYKELPSINQSFYPIFEEVVDGKKSILHEYNSNKKNNLTAYEGVIDTLKFIKNQGSKIVAFTESNVFFTKYRIKHLGLDTIIDTVYSPEGYQIPGSVYKHYSEDYWDLKQTEIKTLPKETRKPNVEILNTIIKDFNADKSKSIYIGDKLDRDIYMAQQAGVISVHAEYGHIIDGDRYELLKEVTHWSLGDVEREKQFKSQKLDIPSPDYTLKSFDELITLFHFTKFADA
ncbi:HAD family hydrolase [Mucilaginibacter sp. UC70_90]